MIQNRIDLYRLLLSRITSKEGVTGVIDFQPYGLEGLALFAAYYGPDAVAAFDARGIPMPPELQFPALSARNFEQFEGMGIPGVANQRAVIAADLFMDHGPAETMAWADKLSASSIYFVSRNPDWVQFVGGRVSPFDMNPIDLKQAVHLGDEQTTDLIGVFENGGEKVNPLDGPWIASHFIWEVRL